MLVTVIPLDRSSSPEKGVRHFSKLFGERFLKRHFEPSPICDAYALASAEEPDGVPFAGPVNPDNPPYGATSLVWFPTSG